MKKVLVFLVLVLVLCVSVYPQKTFYRYLQNTYDSTTAANYDTLTVINLGRTYEQANLIIENVGAVPCTLSINGGSFVSAEAEWSLKDLADVTDTNYYVIPINNNAGSNATSFIVANGSTVIYELKKPWLELLRIYITQTTGGKVKLFTETGIASKP